MYPLFMIFSGIYCLDIATKQLVRAHLPLGADIKILPFFSLVHVQNTGIAFGLFPEKNIIFIGIGILMTAVIVGFIWKMKNSDYWTCFILAAVLGGAWGNLTDRIFFGHVTDFLDFYWGFHHWPAFNVADSTICVSAAALIIRNMFQRQSSN